MPFPLVPNFKNAFAPFTRAAFIEAEQCRHRGPIESLNRGVLRSNTAHVISSRGFNQIVMRQTFDRQRIMKPRTAPATLPQLAGETEPAAVHMKMTSAGYPFA